MISSNHSRAESETFWILFVERHFFRLESQRMDLDHDDVSQIMAVFAGGRDDQAAGDPINPPERAADEQQQASTKQQATLALEAGFTEYAFDGAIAHKWTGRL